MNRDILQGKWHVLRGRIRSRWGRLTNDDLDVIQGKHDQLVGKLQQRYGKERDQVERDVDRWLDTVEPDDTVH